MFIEHLVGNITQDYLILQSIHGVHTTFRRVMGVFKKRFITFDREFDHYIEMNNISSRKEVEIYITIKKGIATFTPEQIHTFKKSLVDMATCLGGHVYDFEGRYGFFIVQKADGNYGSSVIFKTLKIMGIEKNSIPAVARESMSKVAKGTSEFFNHSFFEGDKVHPLDRMASQEDCYDRFK